MALLQPVDLALAGLARAVRTACRVLGQAATRGTGRGHLQSGVEGGVVDVVMHEGRVAARARAQAVLPGHFQQLGNGFWAAAGAAAKQGRDDGDDDEDDHADSDADAELRVGGARRGGGTIRGCLLRLLINVRGSQCILVISIPKRGRRGRRGRGWRGGQGGHRGSYLRQG